MAIRESLIGILNPCAAALALGVLTAGCGLGPGDYVMYRVASSEQDKSVGCYYPANDVPPDEKSDSSTFRTSATFIIYANATDEDAYYLDTGDGTIEGIESDAGYTFSGKDVDVNYTMPDGTGDKLTTTHTVTVELAVDGKSISGTHTDKTTYKCAGACTQPPTPSCTVTTTFKGSEIDDVQLYHDPG
jgi:hypothetical protein